MAFPTTKSILSVTLFCLVVMQQASECKTGHTCFSVKAASQEMLSRKMLYGLKGREMIYRGSDAGEASSSEAIFGGHVDGWELRKVPSGPDPLHHNGGGPKKPRTP